MEMSDNGNLLSCDPADPRRPPVPGLEGVKYVTEDHSNVGNQASVIGNATGNKKLVQQAFHPALFLQRPRSNSMPKLNVDTRGDKPANNNADQENDNSVEQKATCPPWQRVPSRNYPKKRKMLQSPSPEAIKTSNRFDELSVDCIETNPNPIKKPTKPPPIVLYGIDDVSKLTELLETVAEGTKFTYKSVNKNQLRISCLDVETYKQVIKVVRDNNLIGHTFNRKEERCFRIVIRNLHPSTPVEHIREEIERTGNTVSGEIINAKFGKDKRPTSTFFVNLMPGPQNKSVKELKFIYHQAITIEDPRKRQSLVQCQRCQQYGHTKNYCMRPYRCVKCAQSHKTSECTKRDRNTPAMCALCQGSHPANYKGCEIYKEILKRKTINRPQLKGRKLAPTEDLNAPNWKTSQHRRTMQGGEAATVENATSLSSTKPNNRTYAEVLRPDNEHDTEKNSTAPPKQLNLENLLIKQSEKFDLIIQQMSSLMDLMVKLISKLV